MKASAIPRGGRSAGRIMAGRIMVILGFVIIAAVTMFDTVIRPTLQKMLDYKCRTEAEKIISEAVFGSLGGQLEEYGDLVSFVFDESGRITALKTNQSRVNSLKALLSETVNNGIDAMSDHKVGISVGTLTGVSLFYGKGFTLEFDVEPQGKAETRLISKFSGAGINQTVHSIVLEVTATLSPMLIGFDEDIEVVSDFIISETVIVGSVPDSFSNIVLGEEYYSELANIDI